MKQTIGIILVILGVAYFAFQGFSYTSEEKVLDVGPLQANADVSHSVPYSPILAGAVVIGGVALFLAGFRRHAS